MLKQTLVLLVILVGLATTTTSSTTMMPQWVFASTTDEQTENGAEAGDGTETEPETDEDGETSPEAELQPEPQAAAEQPQRLSETLEVSSDTVSELTQELDAAIADIQGDNPTAENIKIECIITYPPLTIRCQISWLSPAPPTPTDTATPAPTPSAE